MHTGPLVTKYVMRDSCWFRGRVLFVFEKGIRSSWAKVYIPAEDAFIWGWNYTRLTATINYMRNTPKCL